MSHIVSAVICLVALFGFSAANYCKTVGEVHKTLQNGFLKEFENYDESLQRYKSAMLKDSFRLEQVTKSCDAHSMDEKKAKELPNMEMIWIEINKRFAEFQRQEWESKYIFTNISTQVERILIPSSVFQVCDCDKYCHSKPEIPNRNLTAFDLTQIVKNVSNGFTESVLRTLWESIDTTVIVALKEEVKTKLINTFYELLMPVNNADGFNNHHVTSFGELYEIISRKFVTKNPQVKEVKEVIERCQTIREQEICIRIEVLPGIFNVTVKMNGNIHSVELMKSDSYERIFNIIFQKFLKGGNGVITPEIMPQCYPVSNITVCFIIHSTSTRGEHNVTVTENNVIVSNTIETGTIQSIIQTRLHQYEKLTESRCMTKSFTEICIQIETVNGKHTVEVKVNNTVVSITNPTSSIEDIFEVMFKQQFESIAVDKSKSVRLCKSNQYEEICVAIATVNNKHEVVVTKNGVEVERMSRLGSVDEILEEKFKKYLRND